MSTRPMTLAAFIEMAAQDAYQDHLAGDYPFPSSLYWPAQIYGMSEVDMMNKVQRRYDTIVYEHIRNV